MLLMLLVAEQTWSFFSPPSVIRKGNMIPFFLFYVNNYLV